MAYDSTTKLVHDLTEALEGSVPRKLHVEVMSALNRCREMIGTLAAVLVETDKEQKHGELMLEAKLYANVLNGYFDQEGPRFGFHDITHGFNPREYLIDKGVIKREPLKVDRGDEVKAAAVKAAERAREIRKEQADHRAHKFSQIQNLRVMMSEDVESLIKAIKTKSVAPTPKKRGRPLGSKNRPKPRGRR